jgi:hypothetical protein
MEKDRRLQLIDLAIQKHIHDKIDNNSNHHNLKDYETEYQLVLSQLLSVSEVFCHIIINLHVNSIYVYDNMSYDVFLCETCFTLLNII